MSRRPLRILHLFGRMDRGGAELRTLDVMRRLDPREFAFEFCALSGLPGQLDEEIATLGGKVHPLRLGRGFGSRFRELCRSGDFDIVHSHVHHASGYLLRLAQQAGVPSRIAHFRSSRDFKESNWLRRARRRLLCHWIDRHATQILSVSRAVMHDAWGDQWSADARCRILYNGIDVAPFASSTESDRAAVRRQFDLPERCRLMIHVGNFKAVKNHTRVVATFAAIARRHPDVCLLFVGQNSGTSELEQTDSSVRQMLARQGLTDRAIFAGSRDDVPRLLAASDLFVFPSHWEGLPGALLEACAAGLPVLASDLPVVSEVALHYDGIRTLSLQHSEVDWGQAANELLQLQSGSDERRRLQWQFRSGPFLIERSVAELCEVWRQSHASHRPGRERAA